MRVLLSMMIASIVVLVCACGGDAPPPKAAGDAQGEVCPLLDAGPPPACPEGCVWNGKECRGDKGIIIFDQHKTTK